MSDLSLELTSPRTQAECQSLCIMTENALIALVDALNRETYLLRSGKVKDAAALTPQKTTLAQNYASLSNAVYKNLPRLQSLAPNMLISLTERHDSLVTQIAENLKTVAAAKSINERALRDVASSLGRMQHTSTYSPQGHAPRQNQTLSAGIAVNRSF